MSIGTKILNKIVSLAQATGGQVEGNKDVTDEMKNLARAVAEEGVVMLKNDGVLPLKNGEKIGVFGKTALNPVIQGGGCAQLLQRERAFLSIF